MSERWIRRLLQIGAVAALIAVALMAWSFLDPQPIAMMVFMTVGQGLGTLSLLLFVIVVGVDLLRRRFGRSAEHADKPGEGGGR